MSDDSSLRRLRTVLGEEGGVLEELLAGAGVSGRGDASEAVRHVAEDLTRDVVGAGPAQLAAGGPRVRERAAEYELLLEAIYEGYLLHYGRSRLLGMPDADLGLLVGDRLYALGLARLVALEDLMAVAELADVITLTALAHGAEHRELAAAIWSAGARAVGWGPSERHREAKELVRAGAPEALAAMRRAGEPDGE